MPPVPVIDSPSVACTGEVLKFSAAGSSDADGEDRGLCLDVRRSRRSRGRGDHTPLPGTWILRPRPRRSTTVGC